MICEKCQIITSKGTTRTEGGKSYNFCKVCDAILDRIDKTNYIPIFISSNENMTEEEKNIVNASNRRANGQSPWKNLKIKTVLNAGNVEA